MGNEGKGFVLKPKRKDCCMEIRGIIPSVQLSGLGYSFSQAEILKDIIKQSNPSAIRLEGLSGIAQARPVFGGKIIGCLKKGRHITPYHEMGYHLVRSGADYVASGAIEQGDPFEVDKMVKGGIKVIADIATFENAEIAKEFGCVAISTTLSGYVEQECCAFDEPDFGLIVNCKTLGIPVIAEGRFWSAEQVKEAFRCGADAVCIGKAITDIGLKVKYYQENIS